MQLVVRNWFIGVRFIKYMYRLYPRWRQWCAHAAGCWKNGLMAFRSPSSRSRLTPAWS